jgi:peptide methionine sulfoxide reductase MsrA
MDIGPQYESAIFFHSDEQRQLALLSRERAGRRIDAKIVTKLRPAGHFWMAGVEHQR